MDQTRLKRTGSTTHIVGNNIQNNPSRSAPRSTIHNLSEINPYFLGSGTFRVPILSTRTSEMVVGTLGEQLDKLHDNNDMSHHRPRHTSTAKSPSKPESEQPSQTRQPLELTGIVPNPLNPSVKEISTTDCIQVCELDMDISKTSNTQQAAEYSHSFKALEFSDDDDSILALINQSDYTGLDLPDDR